MMDKSTTLSAREAVEYGFVDKISDNSNYETNIDEAGMVAAAFGGGGQSRLLPPSWKALWYPRTLLPCRPRFARRGL